MDLTGNDSVHRKFNFKPSYLYWILPSFIRGAIQKNCHKLWKKSINFLTTPQGTLDYFEFGEKLNFDDPASPLDQNWEKFEM